MHFNKSLLSLFAAISTVTLSNASLQINIYTDENCQDFAGSYWPGSCDLLPQPDGGIGSWLIVCETDGNSCDAIEFYSSNGGGCADEYAVDQLSCGCNADPYAASQSRECQSTYGVGAHYWGYSQVSTGKVKLFCCMI
jgi:hypothetical protein